MTPYTQFYCGQDGDALEVTNSTARQPDAWFSEWATGGRSTAGVPVNGRTALSWNPLWQGINIIAGDIGQTPVRLMKDRFTEQKQHAAWQLLRLRPNGLQAPSTFLETIVQWSLMWGNGVAWIQRQGSKPYRLIPLRPDCLWLELIDFEGSEVLLYHYYSPLRNGTQYVFFPWEVLDIPGLTADGVCGYALHQIAKETIGFGLALEKHGSSTFANGAVPSGVLESPLGNGISKDKVARENLRSEWNAVHRGPDKAGAVAILWEGITYKQMAHTNIDAQWIEAKNSSRYEAASLLNLPPHKLGAMEDSSVRANLEEQNADYKQRTLSRWYNRMAEEFRRKLLTEKEWMSGDFEFVWDTDAFLKGDIDTETMVIDRLIKATVLSPNEGRDRLRLPPRDGGDEYGSPAINPNSNSPSTNGQNKPAKKPANDTQNAHRELLLELLVHFLEREAMSLKQAAGGAKNFVKWLDEFYVNGDAKIGTLYESVMGSGVRASIEAGLDARGLAVAVTNYAKTRHAQILEACSSVTKEQLQATVEKLTGDDQAIVARGLLLTTALDHLED